MVFATKWHLMTYFLMCTQGGHPSHRDAGPLTGWLGLSQEGRASYREAGPLTVRSGRSEGGRASYREAGPLTGRGATRVFGFTLFTGNSFLPHF